jgi:acyl-CoA dehydrogenase
MENDPRQDSHGPHETLKQELSCKARSKGLLTPHGAKEYGCMELSHVEKAIVFEEAGTQR